MHLVIFYINSSIKFQIYKCWIVYCESYFLFCSLLKIDNAEYKGMLILEIN